MMELALRLLEMEVENRVMSKVEGARRWAIKTKEYDGHKIIVYKGGFGNACKRGFWGDFLRDISKYNIRYYEFSYKKDYLEALKILEEKGFECL